ncbi:glycosyltransferase family 2 protein [Alicyclobacillaceae bacterium I2511]|nr:glycosyltransferase family 2 protein [Alicyclobacillaceae bacterium I2511]
MHGDLAVCVQPLVSVLMVTQNRPHHLAASLTAVLNQSLQAGVELCLVNDGGKQMPALQQWLQCRAAGRGWTVRWLDLSSSVGQVAARNRAVSLATGEFLAWCDDDDRWLPERLEQSIATYRRVTRGFKLALVYTDAELVTLRQDLQNWRVLNRRQFAWTDVRALLGWTNPVVPSSWLYRREIHHQVGDFDLTVGHYWDWDFLLRVAHIGEFGRVPACLTLYGVDAQGRNASAHPLTMRADLQRLMTKHNLADLPSSNFLLMLDNPDLTKWQADSQWVWDGTLDIWNGARGVRYYG